MEVGVGGRGGGGREGERGRRTDDEEDDGGEREAEHLDALPAPLLDQGERHPIPGNQADAGEEHVREGEVDERGEHVVDGLQVRHVRCDAVLGYERRREPKRGEEFVGVQSYAVERDLQRRSEVFIRVSEERTSTANHA